MRRFVLAAILAMLPLIARAQTEQQQLVDRATLTLQEMLGVPHAGDRLSVLRQARAVMICPRVFRAGFIFGGAGGDCVLSARDGAGSWSDPAFFHMGSFNFGLQAGIQDAELVMMIMTGRGLAAVMDNEFKIGAGAAISVATVGAGVEGSTTAAVGADIVTFAESRGLFGGITLDGALLSSATAWNRAYYGQDLAARQIVMQMAANNPAADPLRATLTRFGGAPAAQPMPYAQQAYPQGAPYAQAYPPPAPAYQPPYAPPSPAPTPLGPPSAARAPVQQQSLPPPR